MSVMKITKANFEELVLNSGKKVLLDFWAPWCGPCRMVGPIVEEIAGEREDIAVGKVNVDEEMELAIEFRVASIPMLVVMNGGKITAKTIGYCPKEEILELLEA
nr:thioredoxin [Oscillospiraceae bacterium]